MLSDKSLPSAVRLIGGREIKGSWWSAPNSHAIFNGLKRIEADPDVLTTRLVSGKVTYLHRNLWGPFLSVATSRARWQMSGLRSAALGLLRKVDAEGEVRVDKLGPEGKAASRKLEEMLLVYTDEIHTEKGYHAKVLSVWSRCPKLSGFRLNLGDPESAMRKLEDALTPTSSGRVKLPWQP